VAGPRAPGYTPLTVEVEPHPFPLEDGGVVVHEGSVRVTVPLVLTSKLGLVTRRARLAFQVCTETTCFPPASVALELPLSGQDSSGLGRWSPSRHP
jgi:Disulphide bond corrector protein DsbC